MKNDLGAILRKCDAEAAYLFGSHAAWNETTESDVDIAVLLPNNTSREQRFETRLKLMSDLAKVLEKKVDVVVLNDLSSLFFKYVILKEGKLIFEKVEERRIDFEMRTMGEYFDFQPFLETYNKNYVKNSL